MPVINNAGHTAFMASMVGAGVDATNDSGVWFEGNSGLTLAVRRGSHAPGTPAGVNFDSFSSSPFNNTPAFNNADQLVFSAKLTGNGVDSTNNRGIWATDGAGALHLIARTGDLLDVAPGDFRVISDLQFVSASGNGDGRSSGFNNVGQVAFRAAFTDGAYGVFVSNVAAVPEPNALALLVSACVMVALALVVLPRPLIERTVSAAARAPTRRT